MTAADLSGRDLDVACALAMGSWYRDGDRWGITGRRACYSGPVRYSADPTTLDEMDEWLSAHDTFPPTLTLRRVVDDERTSSTIWTASMRSSYEDGTTINLAFARLVVAVKEAMP